MARKVDAFFPQRERPASIYDRGFVGRAQNIHIEGGDITDVNEYVRDHVPHNTYIWVVAYGKAYISSGGKQIAHFKEHRTIMAYVPYSQFFSGYYQNQLRLNAQDFYNPATELHEIDYFSIRYKEARGVQPPPKTPEPPKRQGPKLVQSPFTGEMVEQNRLTRAERKAISEGKTYKPKR